MASTRISCIPKRTNDASTFFAVHANRCGAQSTFWESDAGIQNTVVISRSANNLLKRTASKF
jgi:hypothetical protein